MLKRRWDMYWNEFILVLFLQNENKKETVHQIKQNNQNFLKLL